MTVTEPEFLEGRGVILSMYCFTINLEIEDIDNDSQSTSHLTKSMLITISLITDNITVDSLSTSNWKISTLIYCQTQILDITVNCRIEDISVIHNQLTIDYITINLLPAS